MNSQLLKNKCFNKVLLERIVVFSELQIHKVHAPLAFMQIAHAWKTLEFFLGFAQTLSDLNGKN